MTLFTNARVVTPDDVFLGSVVVEDGLVAAVEPRPQAVRSAAGSTVDVGGDYLVPGVVELHTDVLERHAIPRPTAPPADAAPPPRPGHPPPPPIPGIRRPASRPARW